MALQLYRQSAVGDTLNDALHEMVSEEKISGALADRVMLEVVAATSLFIWSSTEDSVALLTMNTRLILPTLAHQTSVVRMCPFRHILAVPRKPNFRHTSRRQHRRPCALLVKN